MSTTAYLVDASPYIFRAYFALPDSITDPAGRPVQAVYGFRDFLLRLLRRDDLTHLAVAFDGSLTTSFRNEIYAGYKEGRHLPPPELEAQQVDCREVAAALGARTFVSPRYEADDLVATLHERVRGSVDRVVVVSGDKDLAQLVDDTTALYDLARDRWYDAARVLETFGVTPERILDWLALVGDPVDSIPGVAGVGKKTAVALVAALGSLDEIYADLDAVEGLPLRGAASVRKKLEAGRESAELSRRLAELVRDVELDGADPEDLVWRGPSTEAAEALAARLGFGSLVDRLPRPRSSVGRSS